MKLLRRRKASQLSIPGTLLTADRTVDGIALSDAQRHPAPIVAALDEPAGHDLTVPGVCRFRGWAIALDGRPVTARVRVGNGEWRSYPCNLPHEGVGATVGEGYGDAPNRCGFDFRVEPEMSAKGGVQVELELSDGQHVVSIAPFRVRLAETQRQRADYKAVWNAVSGDVETAKTAVAGYTDEDVFREMADVTVATLAGNVGLGPDDVVLEIGAGVGRVGPAIAPIVKRWIATDVSENMLEHARERNAEFDNIDYVPISGWDLAPIESESIDVVYSTVVFMHLDEWERWGYVKEAMRVLRPGGRCYVDNYNLLGDDGWTFFIGTAENYHPLDRPANISKSSTPDELRAYFTRAGFEDIVVQESSMFTWAYGRKPQ